jgi:hypothetical protein
VKLVKQRKVEWSWGLASGRRKTSARVEVLGLHKFRDEPTSIAVSAQTLDLVVYRALWQQLRRGTRCIGSRSATHTHMWIHTERRRVRPTNSDNPHVRHRTPSAVPNWPSPDCPFSASSSKKQSRIQSSSLMVTLLGMQHWFLGNVWGTSSSCIL